MQSSSAENAKFTGPASNSINHDFDEIILFLGVLVNVSIDYAGKVTQSLDFSQMASSGFPSTGYFVVVGCLNPISSNYDNLDCQSERTQLANWNIGSDAYPDILAADLFWDPNNQPTTIDPNRFKPVEQVESVSYSPNQDNPTIQVTNTNSLTVTNTVTATDSHSVGFSIRIGDFDKAKLTISDKMTFTNESTTSNRTGNTDMSTFTITMPSAPYNGPASLNIYVDTIYKTFMFSFIPPPPPQ